MQKGTDMNVVKAGVTRSLAVATAILFAIMVLAVVWQVFTREVTKNPAAWTEELARYVFVWTSLMGATLVFAERGHIAVTFVVDRLPRPVRKGVAVVIQLAILIFAVGILVIGGLGAAQNTWSHQLTALPGTIGMAYLVLPITGVVITLIALVHLVEDLRGQGPLTALKPRTEDEVPETPGINQAAQQSLLVTEEPVESEGDHGSRTGHREIGGTEGAGPPDEGDRSSNGTDPKEK